MLHTEQILLLHTATLQQGKGKEEVYLVQGAVWLASLRGQYEASGGADGGFGGQSWLWEEEETFS